MPTVNNASLYGKNSVGQWKAWDTVWAKYNGIWTYGVAVWVKKDGIWKQVFVRLTAATNLGVAVTAGSTTATFTWTAGLGADGYRIYNGSTLVKTVAGGSSTTTTVTIDYYVAYTFKVVAYAGTQEAAATNIVSVNNSISAPTALSITGGSGTKAVTLSWTAGSGQSTYYIYRNDVYIAQTTSLTYDTNLPDYYTSYTYKVRGFYLDNTSGATEASKSASMATPVVTASSRTIGAWGYTANYNEWDDVNPNMYFSWGAIDGASSYDVYNSAGTYISNTTGTSTTIGVGGTRSDTLSYKVRALHSGGSATGFSGTASFYVGKPQLRFTNESIKYSDASNRTSNTNKVYVNHPVGISLPANCRFVSFRAELSPCFATSSIDNDGTRQVYLTRPSVYGTQYNYTASEGNPSDRTFGYPSGYDPSASNNYGFTGGTWSINVSGSGWANDTGAGGAPSGAFYLGWLSSSATGPGRVWLTLSYRDISQTETANSIP